MADDVINIKNAPEVDLTYVIGHDSGGKGGRKSVADFFSFGTAGGSPGPLDASEKIPAGQLPPLQHDVGEAAEETAMLALDVTAPAMALRTDFTPPHIFMLTADPATDIANWHDTGELGAGGADPAAKVGPTATNGTANTFMRSDAAPAINLTVNYSWGGAHEFKFSSTDTAPSVKIASDNPQLELRNTGASANEQRWNWATFPDQMALRALNDAGDVADTAWLLTRSGRVIKAHSFQVDGNPALDISTASGIVAQLPVNMSAKKITAVADPTDDQDGATKKYVDDNAFDTDAAHTWSDIQTFHKPGGGHSAVVQVRDTLAFENTASGTDEKWWDMQASNASLNFRTVKDDNTNATTWMSVARSGLTVTSITIAADLHLSEKKIVNMGDPDSARDGVNLQTLDARLSAAQRTAIDALDPGTAAVADIVNALQAT